MSNSAEKAQIQAIAGETFDLIVDYFTEKDRQQALHTLSTGASFEQWFAFESRVALERQRKRLAQIDTRLLEQTKSVIVGTEVDKIYFDNESGKVDLIVGMVGVDEDEYFHPVDGDSLAFEFKLIHNNKNWRGRCESLWNDILAPPRGKLSQHIPRDQRFGVLVEVFHCFAESLIKKEPWWHPGQIDDLQKWRKDWKGYLRGSTDECEGQLRIVKAAPLVKSIDSPLLSGTENSVTMYLVCAAC